MQKSRSRGFEEDSFEERFKAKAKRINRHKHLHEKHVDHAIKTKDIDELIELEEEELY